MPNPTRSATTERNSRWRNSSRCSRNDICLPSRGSSSGLDFGGAGDRFSVVVAIVGDALGQLPGCSRKLRNRRTDRVCGLKTPLVFDVALEIADLVLKRASQLVGGASQFSESLPEYARNFGELFRPEQQKSNEQDENDFEPARKQSGSPLTLR